MIQPRDLLLLICAFSATANADDLLTIAVASNFRATAEQIATAYTDETGLAVRFSSGSTGKLYAQIINGAPYDVFLAADTDRPRLLEASSDAVEGSLQVYADGKLLLVSAAPELKGQDCSEVLSNGSYKRLAIANPLTAPYGAAARAYLEAAGLWDDAKTRTIMGENISQTFQFVATGNATLGIVAASLIEGQNVPVDLVCRSVVEVPQASMLRQGGVILRSTDKLDSARSFMTFLKGKTARAIMISHGYAEPAT